MPDMRAPTSSIKSKFFAFGLLVLLGLACFAPEAIAETRTNNIYWTPKVATEGGMQTDLILNVIFVLTVSVFVLVNAFFVYYLIRYRRRPGVKAEYTHGNNTAEIIWTLIPTAIFLSLAVWGDRVWHELVQTPAPEDAVVVEVVGYQFAWDFRYGGADGELDPVALEKISTENKFGLTIDDPNLTDDFASTELVVPEGHPVHILLRSRDVIHSFYVPEFRIYQDAVPGRTIDWVWFKTIRGGEFTLACSQLCGAGHFNMKAPIKVLPQDEYDKWFAAKVQTRGEEIADYVIQKREGAVAAE